MSDSDTDRASHRPGRHRRTAGAGTWTPAVGAARGSGRHSADPPPPPATPTDSASPATASTPGPPAVDVGAAPGPAARSARDVATSAHRTGPVAVPPGEPPWPTTDELAAAADTTALAAATTTGSSIADAAEPASGVAVPDGPEPAAIADAAAAPQARTTITFAPNAPGDEPDDAPSVYLAPPTDGLSTFDIGTVPASVTPPRSWRKAAWFATVSSSGVVVALLVAGSYLVGQPSTDQAVDGWTGIRGEQPELHDEGFAGSSSSAPASTSPSTSPSAGEPSSQRQRIDDVAGVRSSDDTGSAGSAEGTAGSGAPGTAPSGSGNGSGSATTTPTSGPTTTTPPSKPEPKPAERETRSAAAYRFPPDAETMGDRSEIFLNEITENPRRAHEQTGGDLHDEGADGIASRYSHIAYMEIEHITIDQHERVTINTVTTVYNDGTEEQQQRTLRFDEGDKITSD